MQPSQHSEEVAPRLSSVALPSHSFPWFAQDSFASKKLFAVGPIHWFFRIQLLWETSVRVIYAPPSDAPNGWNARTGSPARCPPFTGPPFLIDSLGMPGKFMSAAPPAVTGRAVDIHEVIAGSFHAELMFYFDLRPFSAHNYTYYNMDRPKIASL